LLLVESLAQGRFLLVASLEHEQHALHWKRLGAIPLSDCTRASG